MLNVIVSSRHTHSERRIDPHITVGQLKAKLEPITGIPVSNQSISLLLADDNPTLVAEFSDDSKTLEYYGLAEWRAINVGDTNPSMTITGLLSDTSQVEKYEISDTDYATRQDSVLAYKQRYKIGRFADKPAAKEETALIDTDISVDSRCEVESFEPGLKKLGTVRFVGETKFSKGIWIGVEYDEPLGKNDGSVNGERYFSCRPKYGVFVKPEKVTVGDFPVEELNLEDDEEM